MIPTIIQNMNVVIGSLIIGELIVRCFVKRDSYDHKDSLANFAIGIVNRIITTVAWSAVMLGAFTIAHNLSPFRIDTETYVWTWAIAVLMSDFSFYWYHRCGHEIRALWSIHCVHHNSEDYNLSTSVRLSWIESSIRWVYWLPLPLVGFGPLESLMAYMLVRWYQVLLHTEYVRTLGPLEWILSTPSHHRAHHGKNPQYIDKNYGGVLIIWDRLFGTFQAENEKVKYGTLTPVASYNVFKINFIELAHLIRDMKQAENWGDRVGYFLKPPGWAPEGATDAGFAGPQQQYGPFPDASWSKDGDMTATQAEKISA
ncbi:MAG: sterol desaturase family protein [Pseudobacteriovorax sp.]|nr:sterol desaturase family protein [Pseudobacteriovorax sp.]